jgi:RNA polymerase sigma-70 factor (ECF subfamily)
MAWLMSIARHRAIEQPRHKRCARLLVPLLPERGSADDDEGASVPWRSSTTLLARCVALLSFEQQRCLELAFLCGSSREAIAQLTGSPLGTLERWIHRGLMSLWQCLQGAG